MNQFLATVMGWAPNFAPREWAYCQGQLLAISSNNALFSLLGTIYGGDGRTTFALPDLRGRTLIGQGSGPGLQTYPIGARGGQEFVTLNITEMPVHNHAASLASASATVALPASTGTGTETSPAGHYISGFKPGIGPGGGADVAAYATSADTTMAAAAAAISGTVAIGVTGGSSSHENRHPFQVLNYIIALQGLYPSRN